MLQALLDVLCDAVTSGHKLGAGTPVATSFYSALVVEVLVATSAPYPDGLIQRLLPHLLVGLAPSASPNLRMATLAIAACMMTLTSLSDKMAVCLVTDVCMHAAPATLRETLQFVAVACETQPCMRSAFQGGAHSATPKVAVSATAALLQQPGLRSEIARLRREKCRFDVLAVVLACAAPRHDAAAHSTPEKGAAVKGIVTPAAAALVQADSEESSEEEAEGDGAVSYTHLTLPTTPYV